MLEEYLEDGDYNKGFHDTIVRSVAKRLEDSGLYDSILHNTEYSSAYGDGEIDLCAEAGDRIFLFEMKSTNRVKNRLKAVKQLERAERMVLNDYKSSNVYKFYVYGVGKEHYDLRRIE